MVEAWLDDRDAFNELLKLLLVEIKEDCASVEVRCSELQTIAERKGFPVQAAVLGSLRADALCELGRVGEAYSVATETLPVLRKDNDPERLSKALNGLGLIQNQLGDRGAAVQSLIESLNIAKTHGIHERERSAHLNIGFIYALENCPEDALAHFERVIGDDPTDFVSGLATSNVSSLYIDIGKLKEAEELIKGSLVVHQSPYIRGLLTGNYAMILAHRGDDAAWMMAEEAVTSLLAGGRINYSPTPFHAIAKVYWELGLGKPALKAIVRASDISNQYPSKPYADEISLLTAKILVLNGSYEEASRRLLKEIDGMQSKFADQMKLRLELSQQRWNADWARKEAELLRGVNKELSEARHAADRANAIKSQFLANMSHEIRTPLHGVIGMTSLLMEMELSPASRDHVQSIRSSSETLLSLLNDILDLSKIEAEKLSIQPRDFRIEEAVDAVLATLQSKAIEKSLEFFAVIEASTPRVIRADPDRIRQIWTNLIGNAIKFTNEGSVIVRIGWQQLEGEQSYLTTSVQDTGIGVPAEAQDTIFESFSQVITTGRQYGGTGLGLAISRQLSIAMGGDLSVESTVGKGSDFKFRVPAEAVQQSDTVDVSPGQCLILEDSQNAAECLGEMLSSIGMKPMVGGWEDLLALSPKEWAAVFVDESWLDGHNNELGTLGGQTRLVVTTSKQGDLAGKWNYLRKPFRFGRLRALFSADKQGRQDAPKRPMLLEGRRFLVIEDNDVNQQVMSGLLEMHGARVDVAENGEVGLSAMRTSEYDVIFMDSQMPVMNGYECTRQIRQIEKGTGAHRKIIATTASAMGGDLEECFASGMDGYVPKPITHEALLEVIDSVLSTGNG